MTEKTMVPRLQQALEQKLLSMGDDELILGHRNSEWTGHAPILEEDIAFANIAQDEMGHARLWYEILQTLNGTVPDQLIFFRGPEAYRNVRLVELPKGDWAFSMLRQYLFDSFEMIRAEHLVKSQYRPLAEAAAKVRLEEMYHARHTQAWVKRLGLGTEESNRRLQQALMALWLPVFQLFEPLSGEPLLVQAGFVPEPLLLRQEWQEQVRPFLEEAGLSLPEQPEGHVEGRAAHTPHLSPLLAEMQQVARIDVQASW